MFPRTVILLPVIMLLMAAVLHIVFPGLFWPRTTSIEGGDASTKGVSELKKLELGGMDQYILLRGMDITNPVLLWLHGGPGAAQMPLAHALDRELEKEYIVVHWDQRGAGKSNHSEFDKQTMAFDRFKSDALELIHYLKNRFGEEKVFLLGHSWGSQLGIELAAQYPQELHAYIGVSQVVDNHRGYEIGYEWLIRQINESGSQDDLRRLEELGDPPYTEHGKHVAFARMIGDYGGNFDVSMTRLAWMALRAPEYSFRDYLRWFNGANRGSGPMWDTVYATHVNLMEKIPSLEIPVFFLTGENDYNTPMKLVKEYHNLLDAPCKKVIVFDNSAHTPFLGENEAFNRTVIRIKHAVLDEQDAGESSFIP